MPIKRQCGHLGTGDRLVCGTGIMAHGRSFDNEQRSRGLSDVAPHYHGHRERLRARFREAGSDAVTDYELLELVA